MSILPQSKELVTLGGITLIRKAAKMSALVKTHPFSNQERNLNDISSILADFLKNNKIILKYISDFGYFNARKSVYDQFKYMIDTLVYIELSPEPKIVILRELNTLICRTRTAINLHADRGRRTQSEPRFLLFNRLPFDRRR